MTLRRFHATDLQAANVPLDRDQARHALKALRLKDGDAVELFDGCGLTATGTLRVEGPGAIVNIETRRQCPAPAPAVDLAIALPKGPRAASMIEMLSEVGADRVIPLTTARGVVEARDNKVEKLQRVAHESAKQCRRDWTLRVDPPARFKDVLASVEHNVKLIADTNEPEDQRVIFERLQTLGKGGRVLVLIGPEGGWTETERADAAGAGFLPWSLGPHVMRIGTAAVAAAALLRRVG